MIQDNDQRLLSGSQNIKEKSEGSSDYKEKIVNLGDSDDEDSNDNDNEPIQPNVNEKDLNDFDTDSDKIESENNKDMQNYKNQFEVVRGSTESNEYVNNNQLQPPVQNAVPRATFGYVEVCIYYKHLIGF